MEKPQKQLVRDIKQLPMKVNDETKQFEKELNETKEVLVSCRKEYTKLYNENIKFKKYRELLNHKNNKDRCI